ncbi:MAG TPA: efflux RND transporter permease subunit, partial [Polyangia bacterium]|nr:efflux RND transporter permease subunit [Polyangia bacterium]
MRITDVFVRRPVLSLVVNLIIVIAGVQAIRTLNVRQYPRLESATIVIRTPYVGASADLVRGFITTPIERSVAAGDGIDYIESQSDQGLSTINVHLQLNVDTARALADISARVNQVRGDLPPEAEVPAISLEPSDAAFASMYLSFDSKILQDNQVTDYLIRVVQPRLSAVEGVQKADILGGRTFALRAWLKPDRMAALNVSPSQVRQALAANNYLSAVGQTKGAFIQLNLSATTGIESVEDFRRLVIRQQGATLVRLGDVADVVLGADNYDMDVRMSGASAVFMGVWVLPNANALDVIKRVRAELIKIQGELPTGLSAMIAFDATKYIDSAIHEVRGTLIETIAIVVVVIFLFLGSLRTVLVPVVAIPVSLIGAIFLMQVFGFTLNLLTLLAIVLSVGLVVDDAIVVVENVDRHMREGRSAFQASLLGARELVGPIIAMTITLAAVYAPIGFQGGLTGALFREFVFTLAGAVLISGVVALTLSPMMSSKLLGRQQQEGRFTAFVDGVFHRIKARYARMLAVTLANRPAVYIVWGVLSLLVIPMYMFSAKELAPTEDQGVVFNKVDVPANATLEQITPFTEKIFRNFQSIPEFSHSFQLTLPSGGFGGMIVKPWEERSRSIFQIHQELFGKQMMLTGVQAPVFLPPALPSAGIFPVELVIASTASHEELVRAADQMVVEAIKSGQFAFPPVTDVKIDQAKAEVVLDREKIASMGLNMQQVGADLATMLGGNYINRFNMDGRSYKVIAQVERAGRLTPADLGDIHVTGPAGTLIPLSSIATFRTDVEPRSLNRFQQLNAV